MGIIIPADFHIFRGVGIPPTMTGDGAQRCLKFIAPKDGDGDGFLLALAHSLASGVIKHGSPENQQQKREVLMGKP